MVSRHCGMILDQSGVVWVTLRGQEDSCDLFESRAGIRETPGAEHRLPGQIVGKWFWERNFLIICVSFSIPTPGTGLRMLGESRLWREMNAARIEARQEVPGAYTRHPGMIHHRADPSKCSQVEISKMNKFWPESTNILLERPYTSSVRIHRA